MSRFDLFHNEYEDIKDAVDFCYQKRKEKSISDAHELMEEARRNTRRSKKNVVRDFFKAEYPNHTGQEMVGLIYDKFKIKITIDTIYRYAQQFGLAKERKGKK